MAEMWLVLLRLLVGGAMIILLSLFLNYFMGCSLNGFSLIIFSLTHIFSFRFSYLRVIIIFRRDKNDSI